MNLHRREIAQIFLRYLTLLADLSREPGVGIRVVEGIVVDDLSDQVPENWDLGDPGALRGQSVVS